MLNLQTASFFGQKSYADLKNSKYSSTQSSILSIQERWNETYKSLSPYMQQVVDATLESAKYEFKRRNPNKKYWSDIELAEAKDAILNSIKIDGTMQRQLDIMWVLSIINGFLETMVVPIQVYRPNPSIDEFLAWDGQHTLVALYLIATHIFEENPSKVIIPVNIYKSSLKAQMRANFISLNSKEGKKQLEAIDIWEQMIYGVRVDGSTNPLWVEAEKKQQHIERCGLFVTSKKFGDEDQPGAISRLQEINKLNVDSVGYLCEYLTHVTKLQRPTVEKELVMMAHYFDRCRVDNIKIDKKYIADLAALTLDLWDADFSPNSIFWIRASNAYHHWHNSSSIGFSSGRFNKEPVHGFPFLIAQLQKSFNYPIPKNDSKSNFWPDVEELF